MAFIVEDGTGVDGANSLVSVAYADVYHADRGRDEWTSSDLEKKQASLVLATDYLELRFGHRFLGQRVSARQPLSFPRDYLYYYDRTLVEGVPDTVKNAVCEYAFKAIQNSDGEILPDLNVRAIRQETKRVGPIEHSRTFESSATVPDLLRVPGADFYLREFVAFLGGVHR